MSKKNKFLILIAGLVVALSAITLMVINNNNYNNFAPTIFEKKWLNDHKEELVDLNIFNDVPVFGMDGEGVAFDYLTGLKKAIDLDFNVMAYKKSDKNEFEGYSFKVLGIADKLTDENLVFYKDNYVLISKNQNKVVLENLNSEKIGLLKGDLEYVKSYLGNNVVLTTADNNTAVVKLLNDNQVEYILLPHNLAVKEILSLDNYYVNYNFNDISLKYILELDKDNKSLNAIVKKYFYFWQKKHLQREVDDARLKAFYEYSNISSEEQAKFNSHVYKYGYVNELPYADKVGNDQIGVINSYVDDFADFSGITIKYFRYTNKKLAKADDLDLVFKTNDVKLGKDNKITSGILNNKYLVLVHEENKMVIDSLKTLDNFDVKVLSNSGVNDYLKANTKAKLKVASSVSNLVKNTSEEIVIVDTYVYDYLRNTSLKNMQIRYDFQIDVANGFAVKTDTSETLYKAFNYYLMGIKTDAVNNGSIYYLVSNPMKQSIYDTLARYVIIIIVIICITLIVGYNMLQKKKVVTKIQKDEKLKYIDQMTSLKNRNYLNDNISAWDENNIYPQAIMIVDLNNIKFINDNFGHEAGDEVIRKAASILMNGQKENSDIIRIDGNEFLIYLLGYPENEVVSYMRKLYKELKTLPHENGAALGYSMIVDEIKTLDDAINEATLDMRVNKETSQRN